MRRLWELSCPIVAMLATLKQEYVRSDQCLILTKGMHRQNLQLRVQCYRPQKQHDLKDRMVHMDDDSDKEDDPDSTISADSY